MKTAQNLKHACLTGIALLVSLTCGAQVTVTQIAAGTQHSLFIKSDGSLWVMGNNYYGQLGDGLGDYNTNVPEMIVPGGVTGVAARGNHSFYETSGPIWAMGDNQYGELGDGTSNNIYVPKQVGGGYGLAAGYEHTLYLATSGLFREVEAMGDNTYGELGDGTYVSRSTAERIELDNTIVIGATPVNALAAGDGHSLMLKSDGSLWSMGFDGSGQLGNGTIDGGMFRTNKAEKVVPGGVTAIAAGYLHTLFIKSDGSLWAVGDNEYGELGSPYVRTGNINGSTNVPVMVVPNNVTAVAGGFYDSFFIKTGGSLWTMGYNSDGQLGDGVTPIGNYFTNLPEEIVAAGVTAVAAGDAHTLFLASDGSLWGMGQSFEGQLGPNYSTDQNVPVQIIGPMVANGGFELGGFNSWTRGAPGVPSSFFIGTNSVTAHSGSYGANLPGSLGAPQIGFLSQTLKTVPGMTYSLSFWLNTGDGLSGHELQVSWGGYSLPGLSNLVANVWTQLQYHLPATNTSTVLQFNVGSGFFRVGLDDVSVVPLVQPGIVGVTLAGTNLVLNATNGQWGGTYVTFTSTNPAQPLAQWTPIATNTLDGSGNFTVTATNAVNPGEPKRFYALQLQ